MQNWLSLPGRLSLKEAPFRQKLTLAQKAIVHWAKVDDYAAILDMDCTNGQLLQYYLKRYRLRACGMASDTTELDSSQNLLQNAAEVLKADKYDIPWLSESFDSVFMTRPIYNAAQTETIIKEAKRVMKPGAQFVIAVPGLHLPSRFGMMSERRNNSYPYNPYYLMDILHQEGFMDVSMRLSSFRYATVIAHAASLPAS